MAPLGKGGAAFYRCIMVLETFNVHGERQAKCQFAYVLWQGHCAASIVKNNDSANVLDGVLYSESCFAASVYG